MTTPQPPAKSWQTLFSEELQQQGKPQLRASAAGKCVRSLTYSAMGQDATNPPDRAAVNRMALGHMAEILIIKDLENNGWQTDHTVLSENGQLELEFPLPKSGITVKGHPDGICRHPRFTNNLWVALECKSMSVQMAEQVEAEGVAAVYPHYLSQIALYGHELYRQGLVSHPEKGVWAMMDRNGVPLPPERYSWKPQDRQWAIDNLDAAAVNALNGELPERPYARDSRECLYCAYHKLCHGASPRMTAADPKATNTRISLNEREMEAARLWSKLQPQVSEAKQILQNAVDRAGGGIIDTGDVIASYFVPKDSPAFDEDKLRKTVPSDILQRCAKPQKETPRKAFWVRSGSKK